MHSEAEKLLTMSIAVPPAIMTAEACTVGLRSRPQPCYSSPECRFCTKLLGGNVACDGYTMATILLHVTVQSNT